MVDLLYTLTILGLSVYAFQSLLLSILFLLHREPASQPPEPLREDWPAVTVQLPIYNERHVVERLIDAAAGLDYPRDRLHVQVLDDSTDDTTRLAEVRAALWRARGIRVEVVRRPERTGFKAGALAYGVAQSGADYFAVFDADFRPRPDFLRRTIPHLLANRQLGMLQTRWSHLNADYSLLTRVEALALDGHFVVEQTGRSRSGLLINFNGSGGIWRRQAIEEAGGWQSDTMTEDMDLSYRAQLAGWRSLYLRDVDAPAELPVQMEAFKQQQARWAQGSVQCLRKLAIPILRSDRLSISQKVMALVHISGYFTQPLLVALLLLSVLALLLPLRPETTVWLGLAGLGPPLMYGLSQSALYPGWRRRLLAIPALAAIGAGISLRTSLALLQGVIKWGGTFRRTPKFRIEGRRGNWTGSAYRLGMEWTLLAEAALMIYAAAGVGLAIALGRGGAIPLLALFLAGYAWSVLSSLWQGGRRRTPGRWHLARQYEESH